MSIIAVGIAEIAAVAVILAVLFRRPIRDAVKKRREERGRNRKDDGSDG